MMPDAEREHFKTWWETVAKRCRGRYFAHRAGWEGGVVAERERIADWIDLLNQDRPFVESETLRFIATMVRSGRYALSAGREHHEDGNPPQSPAAPAVASLSEDGV